MNRDSECLNDEGDQNTCNPLGALIQVKPSAIDLSKDLTLKIDNLTISGGTRGVHVSGNALLWADNVTVESYTQRGISVIASVGWIGSVTVDGTKQSSSDEIGILTILNFAIIRKLENMHAPKLFKF